MAAPSFERAVAHVLKSEGGYVDNPADPGGATNRGITLATLSKYRGKPVSKQDVKNLTAEEAKAIYRGMYWKPIRGDDLPAGLDLAVFDFCVNSGANRAARYLQAVLGVAADGAIGPRTIAAANKADAAATIRGLCTMRLKFLQGLDTWTTFGAGWKKRVMRVEQEALSMTSAVAAVVPPPPDIEPVEASKANWLVSLLSFLFRRKTAT